MRFRRNPNSHYSTRDLKDNEPIEFFGLPGSFVSSAFGYVRVRSLEDTNKIMLVHRNDIVYDPGDSRIPSCDEIVRISKKML